jgi:hypothetical protein
MNRLEQLGELAAQAEQVAGDRRLQEALDAMARDPAQARLALTAPREFAAEFGVEVPENLDISFLRPPIGTPRDTLGGKYLPDFEFFTIRQFNCRTWWVPTKDEDGKTVGYEQVTICLGFEIIPKFLPRGPWS